MSKRAIEIIAENIQLSGQYKNKSILDMVKHQEKLIEEFEQLGYARAQFFEVSRSAIGIGHQSAHAGKE